MRRISAHAPITTFLIYLAMWLTACGGTSGGGATTPTPTTAAKAAVTVGMVADTGGLNDSGFNQFTHVGYEKARAQYGFPDVVSVASVSTDAEYTKKIATEAQQADMVIGVGFLMENAIYTVAKHYPNNKFAIIHGFATNPTDQTDACLNLSKRAQPFSKV